MKNVLVTVVVLVSTLTFIGCIRGHAGHELNPNQVRAIPGPNGTTEHLILPIKGKPYASGAQWIYDQIVAAQAGGDIQSITVDPATVQVTFSEQKWGEGLFIVIGKAHVALAGGKGEFDAYFREGIEGGCQADRVFSTYGFACLPETTAYREGLATWTAASTSPNSIDRSDAIKAQLSIEMLVREITADGAVKMDALEAWKSANNLAWGQRSVLGLP